MNFSGEKYSVKFESVVYSLEQGKELSFALQSSVHITTLLMAVSISGKLSAVAVIWSLNTRADQ